MYKIFNTGDANLIYQNLVNSLYKPFLDLVESLYGENDTFVNNFQFFVGMDFAEKIIVNLDALKSTMGVYLLMLFFL